MCTNNGFKKGEYLPAAFVTEEIMLKCADSIIFGATLAQGGKPCDISVLERILDHKKEIAVAAVAKNMELSTAERKMQMTVIKAWSINSVTYDEVSTMGMCGEVLKWDVPPAMGETTTIYSSSYLFQPGRLKYEHPLAVAAFLNVDFSKMDLFEALDLVSFPPTESVLRGISRVAANRSTLFNMRRWCQMFFDSFPEINGYLTACRDGRTLTAWLTEMIVAMKLEPSSLSDAYEAFSYGLPEGQQK